MQLRCVWIIAVGLSLTACAPAILSGTDGSSSSGSSSGSTGSSNGGHSSSSSGSPSSSSSGSASSSSSGTTSSSSSGATSSSSSGSTSSSSSGGPVTPAYPAAGIRRLGREEVERAATQLLGVPAADLATALGDDTRQAGFTRNMNERVTSVQGDALWNTAQKVAAAAVTPQRLSAIAPCQTSGGSEACASQFIHSFLPGAFRRATTAAEEANLLTVYRAGASGATYADGIALVIAAVLQAPSFLYVTELGAPGASGATTTLTGEEIATNLALLLTGKPADAALLASGKAGTLASADGRGQAARALLAPPGGPSADVKRQIERLVLEWIGADSVASVGKDETQFKDWFSVRGDMLAESQQIVDDVVFTGDGTISSLLTAQRTFLTPALASFYGVAGSGTVALPAYRRGLLLAGAFVATNSYPSVTAPVKRGAMVRKRLLCKELPVPTNLGVITVPKADPTLTTRERFSAHSTNPACSACHEQLDPPGFALEIFDTAGRYRTMENGKAIRTDGEMIAVGDASGTFADAAELMSRIAASKSLRQCFTRQLYRYAAGRAAGDDEETFAAFMAARPSAVAGKVVDALVDYIESDWFAIRRVQ